MPDKKCLIAAEYSSQGGSTSGCFDSSGALTSWDVYYGCIREMLLVTYSYVSADGTISKMRKAPLALIKWQEGLKFNDLSVAVYTRLHGAKRGSVKAACRKAEILGCVKRVIASSITPEDAAS